MSTGQASRASVLTSACLRASGASPRHSAIQTELMPEGRRMAMLLKELCPDAQRRNLLQSTPTTLDHCLSIGIRQQSEGRDRLVCFAKQSLRYGHPSLATKTVGGRGEFV